MVTLCDLSSKQQQTLHLRSSLPHNDSESHRQEVPNHQTPSWDSAVQLQQATQEDRCVSNQKNEGQSASQTTPLRQNVNRSVYPHFPPPHHVTEQSAPVFLLKTPEVAKQVSCPYPYREMPRLRGPDAALQREPALWQIVSMLSHENDDPRHLHDGFSSHDFLIHATLSQQKHQQGLQQRKHCAAQPSQARLHVHLQAQLQAHRQRRQRQEQQACVPEPLIPYVLHDDRPSMDDSPHSMGDSPHSMGDSLNSSNVDSARVPTPTPYVIQERPAPVHGCEPRQSANAPTPCQDSVPRTAAQASSTDSP